MKKKKVYKWRSFKLDQETINKLKSIQSCLEETNQIGKVQQSDVVRCAIDQYASHIINWPDEDSHQ